MKKTSLFVFFWTISLIGFSQIFPSEVIGSGGDFKKSGQTQLSWTIGEAVVQSITGTSQTLDQGFQQAQLYVTDLEDDLAKLSFKVFPNPTNQSVFIEMPTSSNSLFQLNLFAPDGKMVLSQNVNFMQQNPISLDLSSYADGIYFLQLNQSQSLSPTWFKIEKTH